MDGVIRKTRKDSTANHTSAMDHRRIQKSSTLNRKFVRKPVAGPKINNTIAAGAKTVNRQAYKQGFLRKTGSVKLQPIHQNIAAQGAARQAKGGANVEKSAMQDVASASQRQNQTQVQQAARRAATRRVVQKRSGDIYVKNTQAVAAKQKVAAKRMASNGAQRLTAQQMKDRAIQRALNEMNRIDQSVEAANRQSLRAQFDDAPKAKGGFFKNKRFAIAASMAVFAVALLGYLVYLNMPDLSARVAAMHAGIEKSYPSYVPMSYRLDGLVKEENGRITMNFRNEQGNRFTLLEEKSSWDSMAVLANYVKKNWGSDYSVAKGQGLTIYISGSNAVWVNGGILYIIEDAGGHLNSNDLHDVAVSL